jgi:hypothetical protein
LKLKVTFTHLFTERHDALRDSVEDGDWQPEGEPSVDFEVLIHILLNLVFRESVRMDFSAEWTHSCADMTIQGNSWWLICLSPVFYRHLFPSLSIPHVKISECKSSTRFAQVLVQSILIFRMESGITIPELECPKCRSWRQRGVHTVQEMVLGRRRYPFEIPFTFSLNRLETSI